MSASRRSSDMGAGLSLAKTKIDQHPGGPMQHGAMGQAERGFSAASTFLSGIMAISASQLIGAPLKLVDPKFYDRYMAWTKESFAVLVTTMTQWWSPTAVRVTGDESMKGQLYQMEDGTLKCNFPHRIVMMANHQLYTDWLYLWWIAYTNKMHGRIYIILKESLKNIPIFGWSAQFYNFIFLARKWETDKPRFKRSLQHLSNPADPMWLLIFPEGTNLSGVTREKSKAWAVKNGIPDMKHQLLPRSTGLQFCLQTLRESTNWLYDCTIAYEGVPDGQFGQDIFTLRSSFFEGRPPKSVNMYWRRWKISDLPVDNEAAFAMWLRNRWTEKDYLLEHFQRYGAFPEGDPVTAMKREAALKKFAKENNSKIVPTPKLAKMITTEVKAGGWEEFISIFGPVTTAASALSNGMDPSNLDFDALLSKVAEQQNLNLGALGGLSKPPTQDQDRLRKALFEASKAASGTTIASKKPALESLLLKNAPDSQRQLPGGKAPVTAGRHLDPEVQRAIEAAHEQTRQRLMRASKTSGAPKQAPKVQNALPMTPIETIVTRPLSTLAMQQATKRLRNAGVSAGAKKADLSKQVAAKKQAPAQVVNGTASKGTTAQVNGTAKSGPQVNGKPAGQANGTAAKGAKPAAPSKPATPKKPVTK